MQKPAFTTVVRRQLGRRLRFFRDQAGIIPDDVARAKIAHRTKLWRYETGQARVRTSDVMALCHLCAVDYETTDDLVRMADASDERNYIEDDRGKGVEDRYWMHADLEVLASVQVEYSADLVPELLQIPAYTHAVLAVDMLLPEGVVERRGAFQERRRETFFGRDEPGRIEFLIPASVLELVVGSPEIMAEQIAHLVTMDGRDEVGIRVLPGLHSQPGGSFTLMDFDDPDDPSVVCTSCLVGSRYVERPEQVARYREVVGMLRKRSVPLVDHLCGRATP